MEKNTNTRMRVGRVLAIVATIIATICLIFVAIITCVHSFSPEDINARVNESPMLILYLVLFAAVAFALGKALKAVRKKIPSFDWILVLILTAAWCAVTFAFLTGAKELPSSDMASCFDIAMRFLDSEYSAVAPTGSYLSLWPFQTGWLLILEKTMRLFNTTSPLFFQKINVLFCALGLISGYGILRELTDKEEIMATYILLAFTDTALAMECVLVYGNIPCFELTVFAAWMGVRAYKHNKKWVSGVCGVLGGLALILASAYKANVKMFVVILLIAGFCTFMIKRLSKKAAVGLIIVTILCFSSSSFATGYYERCADTSLGKGVPSLAFVAMGLQGRGVWNGFNSSTFLETGYDYAETSRISMDSIKQSLSDFMEEPIKLAKWLYWKTAIQWCNETRASYWNYNKVWEEPRSAFAISVLNGPLRNVVISLSNVRLSALYILLLICAVIQIKKTTVKEDDLMVHLGTLFFLAGFAFSLVWEAHTSYASVFLGVLLPLYLPNLARTQKAENVE